MIYQIEQSHNKLIYNESFEGIMNPEFDSKTGLIKSCFMTNHGGNEKSTYKIKGLKLIPHEKVILKGAGIENVDKKNFQIEYYKLSGDTFKLNYSSKYIDVNKVFNVYDKLLFNIEN